jgi:hypothetical protein
VKKIPIGVKEHEHEGTMVMVKDKGKLERR